jgi:hypothetical protein
VNESQIRDAVEAILFPASADVFVSKPSDFSMVSQNAALTWSPYERESLAAEAELASSAKYINSKNFLNIQSSTT